MKGKKHTSEQIIRKLREAERMKAEGKDVGQICQQLQVTEQTFYRWKNEYGSMSEDATRELRSLREENGRLKKAVADLTLDKQILQEALKGK